jgi:hypothetical protein
MTLREIMEGISSADLGKPALPCLRIFDLAPEFFLRMRLECVDLCRNQRPSQVGDPKHITYWANPYGRVLQFSLLNATGRYDDTSTDHNQSCRGKHFHDADKYPTLAEFLSAFPHSINFRLNVLGPGAALSPHKEHVCFKAHNGSVGLRLRLHLPVVTNEAAEVILDGQVYHFPERQILFFNHGCVHSARNRGSTDRLHLVWDLLLTPPIAELLFGNGATSFPALRYACTQRTLVPTSIEPPSPFVRLPILVNPSDVARVELVAPQ